jgi:hypothetical protein
MVHLTESQGWQRAFAIAERGSRWELAVEVVERHLTLSFDYMMGMLAEPDAEARRFDPAGDEQLRAAKRMRREALIAGGWRDASRIEEMVERRFGLPERSPTFAARSDLPKPWRNGARPRRNGT